MWLLLFRLGNFWYI